MKDKLTTLIYSSSAPSQVLVSLAWVVSGSALISDWKIELRQSYIYSSILHFHKYSLTTLIQVIDVSSVAVPSKNVSNSWAMPGSAPERREL